MTDLLHQMHHDLRRLARENERLREEVANAATAERARLAGMASEEDRAMVDALDSICRSGRVMYLEWLEAYTTLRARAERAEGALAKRVGEVRAAGLLAYRKAKGEACRLDFQVRCYSCEREYNEVVDGILAALAARGE